MEIYERQKKVLAATHNAHDGIVWRINCAEPGFGCGAVHLYIVLNYDKHTWNFRFLP